MGNWSITIHGLGPHHNENNPYDADRMAEEFVQTLRDKGHRVESATFTVGQPESSELGSELEQEGRREYELYARTRWDRGDSIEQVPSWTKLPRSVQAAWRNEAAENIRRRKK